MPNDEVSSCKESGVSSLTFRTEEGRSLCQHRALDGSLAAGRTWLICMSIHSVFVLIAAILVEGVPVRAVSERRAFVADGRLQHGERRVVEASQLGCLEVVRGVFRMDASKVQDLAGVQVADSGDQLLIQ